MDQNLEKLVELLEKDREIFQMLRQCPYEILRRFEVKDYEADQFVLNQGEIHNRFYIIASGYVDIYVESAHGKRYLLCTYMKGDYIGELEIFKQTGYISRIQSRGKVRILELDRTFFLQWIRTDKNFNEYMIKVTIKYINEYVEEVGVVEDDNNINYLDINGNIDMYKAIDLLDIYQKNVIILLYFYKMTYKEVGDILDMNESTIKMYLRSALKNMKESII